MKISHRLDPSPIKPEEYMSFLGDLQIQGVGLDSASATIDRLLLAEVMAAGRNLTTSLDAKFTVIERAATYLRTSAEFEVFQYEDDASKRLVRISCGFSALFATSNIPSLEMSERFAQSESRVVFWPYLRHFVSDTSYRMSISPILVPLTSEFDKAGSNQKKTGLKRKKARPAVGVSKK